MTFDILESAQLNVSSEKLYESAVNHHSRGENAMAEEGYRAVLAGNPRHDGAMHLLGVIAYQAGQLDESISLIQNAIRLNDQVAMYYDNLGLVLQKKNQFEEAIAAHDKAILLQPRLANAYSNRGLAQQAQGLGDAAVKSFREAVTLAPKFAVAHFNLGNVQRSLGSLDEATVSYRTAIELQPSHWEAHAQLGAVLRSKGEFDNAIAALSQAINLRPNVAWLHLRFGNILKDVSRYEEAIEAYHEAISLNPSYVECYNNLGTVLVDLGRFDEAALAFKRALSHGSDSLPTQYNLSLLHLRTGDYQAGWPLYEARSFMAVQDGTERKYSQPRWMGQPLVGASILVYAEQGLGDTIQFSRFLAILDESGASVILEVPKKMLRLFCGIKGVTHLIGQGSEVPLFHFHCPIMSLPGVLGVTLDSIPAPQPYLSFDEERRRHWGNVLGKNGFKIGIVWQGNPNSPSERGRSAPLLELACLANVPGVRLISLQKVDGTDQLARLPDGLKVETLGQDFDSGPDAFVDTAAVMMELDLIVTVDTSIGHLAGALGRPTWLALQAVPHWVWMQNRSDTPWYPSFRLFRQTERGDWSSVFRSMEEALRNEPSYLERSI